MDLLKIQRRADFSTTIGQANETIYIPFWYLSFFEMLHNNRDSMDFSSRHRKLFPFFTLCHTQKISVFFHLWRL